MRGWVASTQSHYHFPYPYFRLPRPRQAWTPGPPVIEAETAWDVLPCSNPQVRPGPALPGAATCQCCAPARRLGRVGGEDPPSRPGTARFGPLRLSVRVRV